MRPRRDHTVLALVLQAALIGALVGVFGGVAIVILP